MEYYTVKVKENVIIKSCQTYVKPRIKNGVRAKKCFFIYIHLDLFRSQHSINLKQIINLLTVLHLHN